MYKKVISALLLFTNFLAIYAQHNIDITLKHYENDTLIIGNYLGSKTLVKDTLYKEEDGKFYFASQDTLEPGVYLMLLRPDNEFSQFLIDGIDNDFSIVWDTKEKKSPAVKGSKDNKALYDYMNFLSEMKPKAELLRTQIKLKKEKGEPIEKIEDKLSKLNEDVNSYQNEIIKKMPSSITSLILKSNIGPEIPEFEGDEKEVKLKTYRYYKAHYFDNIELSNPAILRTPFLHDRIEYYMENLTVKDPDSIIQSIDYLLEKMEPAPETYRFYTSHLINKYANLKIVGMDAVYVHMIDKYYSSGKATWVDEETLSKMKTNANNIRPILIGKTFPAITTYTAEGSPIEINSIEAEYTLVLFWKSSCGHCTKSMPDVIKFYEEFENKGVKLVTVCTEAGEKTEKCKVAVSEKGMDGFLNTFDEYQRYRRKVYVNSTPKIFILDKEKKIIIKDIPAKELVNVMNNVMEIDKKRALSKE